MDSRTHSMLSPARTIVLAYVLATCVVAVTAHAAPVTDTFLLDDFSVTRNGVLIFSDSFNAGVTLTGPTHSAPNFLDNGAGTIYFVGGTIPETGGHAELNTGNGVIFAQPINPPFVASVSATLATGDGIHNLTTATTFSVTGVFELAIPARVDEIYDIQINDAPVLPGHDEVQLRVHRRANGTFIEFTRFDFSPSASTPFQLIGATALDPNHQQIVLTLSHDMGDTNAISASYAYIDNGMIGPLNTFASTSQLLFSPGTFTSPVFLAVSVVDEPSSVLLLGFGFALIAACLRRKHSHQAP